MIAVYIIIENLSAIDMNALSRLRVRHLQAIVKLYETNNVHRAAEQLCLTQSAVSKLLSEIEDIIGSKLFVRSNQGLQATETGSAVALRSNALLAQLYSMQVDVASIHEGALGRIRLGVTTFSQYHVLLAALAHVREQYPRLTVAVQTGSHDLSLAALQQGKLDCVITRLSGEAVQGTYAWETVYEEPIRIVCSKDHPLAKSKRISSSCLAAAAWVLPPSDAPLRAIVDSYFVAHDLPPPKATVETLSSTLIELLLNKHQLLSPLPRAMAEYLKGSDRLGILQIDPHWTMPAVGLVYKHADSTNSALSLLRKLLREANNTEASLHRGKR